MSAIDNTDPRAVVVPPEKLDGVRTARVFAFVVDWLLVGVLTVITAVVTLGLATLIAGPLFLLVGAVYIALTMGGRHQATWGMRMMGLRVHQLHGGTVNPVIAFLHAALFWILGWWTFPTTFFSSKKRLLHDILLGTFIAKT